MPTAEREEEEEKIVLTPKSRDSRKKNSQVFPSLLHRLHRFPPLSFRAIALPSLSLPTLHSLMKIEFTPKKKLQI